MTRFSILKNKPIYPLKEVGEPNFLLDIFDYDQVPEIVFEDIVRREKEYAPEAKIGGVLIQKMVTEGKEVIVGASRDPSFGPLIMSGLGGIYVEMLKDVSYRLAPLAL
jgi:acetyltransferase